MARPYVRRVLKALLGIAVCLALCWGALVLMLRHPRPTGQPGPAADALARAVEQAVRKDAWDRTLAVRWTFRNGNQHLWDRKRMLHRLRRGDSETLLDLTTRQGRVTNGGAPVHGAAAERALQRAYAAWINDSFWLNPLAKLFDEGVGRSVVQTEDGKPGLLISYQSGGLTPGDSYLWLLGEDHTPRAYRLWVSILPIGGLEFSWEGWQTLPTGARISSIHRGPLGLAIPVSDVVGAPTLAELVPGPDPFAPLLSP